jgi:RNA polymerase sigma-70 factor (ECF subfamily)
LGNLAEALPHRGAASEASAFCSPQRKLIARRRQRPRIPGNYFASSASNLVERRPVTEAVDDAVLIQRSRRGDNDAFGTLVRRYQDSLFNGIYRMVGDYHDAADIAQDVFLKAYRALESFRGTASFSTWLYRIAVNTCISRRRSLAARKAHLHVGLATGADDGTDCDPPAPDPSPPQAAQSREDWERMEEALGKLPEDYRMAVVLRDIEGYSYAEIAAMLDCSQGTVKSRLYRAREMLRKMLA